MACVQGTWWGVGGGVVGGWWGVLGSGCGFWWGLGFWLGVSGGWRCLAGGSRCLPGGWCDVWGPVPLRPLLNSRPHPLGGLWVLAWGRPSVGWCRLFVGGCLVGCSSFLMGWAGLAGGLSCGLCSGWVVLCGRVVVAVRWSLRFGRVFAGGVSWSGAPWVVSRVGELFSSLPCCSRCVGRPGRSGSPSPPSFSPHHIRWKLLHPQTRWANSHVKTLTD